MCQTNNKHNEADQLISLIVSAYNIEDYFEHCLDSIKVQTYKNIECIVIDDESEDSTNSICKEITQNDNRFKLYRVSHAGLAAGRKYGVDQSHGSYIAFIDGDDWLEPDYVENLYNGLIENNSDICICDFYKNDVIANNWAPLLMTNKRQIFDS